MALVKLLVGIVDDRGARVLQVDHVVPACHLRVPVGGLDDVDLAVDVDLLQLVDQHDRRIAIERDVARSHLDRQRVVRP
jgi:hypothetical protein